MRGFHNHESPLTSYFQQPVPLYVQQMRPPEERDKYKAASKVTREINDLAATLTTGQFTFFMDRLQNIRDEITATPVVNVQVDHNVNVQPELLVDNIKGNANENEHPDAQSAS